MKLFAFYPRAHGPLSFFVNAESEEAARRIVDAHVEAGLKVDKHEYGAWPSGYDMVVHEMGEVAENANG